MSKQAYTPSLKVSPYTTIVKTRQLPLSKDYEVKYGGEVLEGNIQVESGESVEAHTLVASAHLPGRVTPFNIASATGCDAHLLPKYMLKKEGDLIKAGEVIFHKKAFIRWFDSIYKARIDGTLDTINTTTGQITISEPPRYIELNAYMKGTVKEIEEQESVTIQTQGAFVQGIFGLGGETWGELVVLGAGNDAVTDEKDIGPELKGKILLTGGFMTLGGIRKAQEIGANGIITASLDSPYLEELLGEDLGVAITGREKMITTIITEGFGSTKGATSELKMADKTYQVLSDLKGNLASMNGATQIRAGVKRPEIIIPLDKPASDVMEDKELTLERGSAIRAIRTPYFGMLGKVTNLPKEPQIVDSGAKLRVVEAELEGYESPVIIPRANVELI